MFVPIKLAILASALALTGCSARPPAISDLRSDVVKVQASAALLLKPSQSAIDAEAQRGCAEYGNVVSHPLSQRCVNFDNLTGICLTEEYLYACKPSGT